MNYWYKDKTLEQLTPEELLGAAKWAYDEVNRHREAARTDFEMSELFRDARKKLDEHKVSKA